MNPQLPPRGGLFNTWAEGLENHPEVTEEVLNAFYTNLYGPAFAYSVDRNFVAGCQTPALVLAGNDEAHPFAIAEEISRLLPNSEFIPEWKDGSALTAATQRMKEFLRGHTPARV